MFSYLTSKFSDLYILSEPLITSSFKVPAFQSSNSNNNNNSWGNVYLCVQQNKSCRMKCKKFDSYESADEHFHKYYKQEDVQLSTLMPICKYTPHYFHPYFLRRKLSKCFSVDILE